MQNFKYACQSLALNIQDMYGHYLIIPQVSTFCPMFSPVSDCGRQKTESHCFKFTFIYQSPISLNVFSCIYFTFKFLIPQNEPSVLPFDLLLKHLSLTKIDLQDCLHVLNTNPLSSICLIINSFSLRFIFVSFMASFDIRKF